MKELTTADWHIRSTVPRCIEATQQEWMDIQRKALERVGEIAEEFKVEGINVGGDIFHSEATASFECIYMVQEFCQRMYDKGIPVRIMAGNHDLINHSSSNIPKSAIGLLLNSKFVFNMNKDGPIKGCAFDNDDYGNAKYIFKHTLTIPKGEIPFEGIECETPESLLEKYPSADVICTGDYHKNFYFEKDGRRVVNSGCLTRQASDFEDYIPGVWIIDLEGTPEDDFWVPVNIEQEFNHNGEVKKELDAAIENFVGGVKKESVTLDFIESVKKELPNHEKEVQNKVNSWIERSGL